MPFVPQIRRQVLQALDQHIIPALKTTPVVQVLSKPPFLFPYVHSYSKKMSFLKDVTPNQLQPSWNWRDEKMSAGRSPYLMFVYQGTMEYMIGITEQMARRIRDTAYDIQQGGIVVRLSAPSCFYNSPLIPGQNGTEPFHVDCKSASILALNLWEEGILAHVATSSDAGVDCSHSLMFKDATLVQMSRLYEIELAESLQQENPSAQALLYALFFRMRRILQTQSVPLSNTSWAAEIHRQVEGESRMEQLCLQAMRYIEKHLEAELSWREIADELDISPVYLNLIFQQVLGTTVMRYVTQRRIEAAKQILRNSDEPLKDVSQLVGFASATSFSGAFKRATGMSPLEYRNL